MFRLFFGLFCEPKNIFFSLFRFVLVFRTGIETTETNRIFLKQTEKISKQLSLLGGLETINFLSRFEPKQTKTQSVSVCFFAKPPIFFFGLFRFVSTFQTGIETTETNRTYGKGN